MTQQTPPTDFPWRPANDGTGPMRWFLIRKVDGQYEYLDTSNGRLHRFGSYESAKRKADALNAAQLTSTPTADLGDVATTKTEHPADGSPRWIAAGPAGSVVYDLLGNHLALLGSTGDVIDSMCKRYADEARDAGSDDAVFALLTDHYRTQIEGGAR